MNDTLFALTATGSGGDSYFSETTSCIQVTENPTEEPTPSPTYSVPVVPNCTVTVQSGDKTFDIEWAEIVTSSTDPDADDFLGYVYYYNGNRRNTATGCCTLSGLTPPGANAVFDINTDNVSVSGDWDGIDVTSLDELKSAVLCDIVTFTPTTSPTREPSSTPSISPTKTPTGSLYFCSKLQCHDQVNQVKTSFLAKQNILIYFIC